jgi:hypothetical protein
MTPQESQTPLPPEPRMFRFMRESAIRQALTAPYPAADRTLRNRNSA